MRKLMITAILPVACLLSTQTTATPNRVSDSAKITHVIDGNISEWKIEKFETDRETELMYSIDHDATNLYLAMKVPNQGTQMKMMMNGMSLFLDKKGKRKEGTGIEFPIKKEGGGRDFSGGGVRGGRGGGSTATPGAERPDPKQMRENLAATMILLKTFGFDDQEDKTQLISTPNGISVAFDWDDANNFYLEYSVPISFLGTTAALNGKPLGIGWKINGMALVVTGSTTELVGVPAGSTGGGRGGGGGGGRGAGSGRSAAQDFGNSSDSRFKEQSIWTKYTLTF